jgi:transcriptional regulator with XRE-family HTH domain
MDNILSVKQDLAGRVRARRREGKMSQTALAERAAVSLGSIKRFENQGEISLSSLLRIAVVLGYVEDFANLFERKNYQSLEEVLNEK